MKRISRLEKKVKELVPEGVKKFLPGIFGYNNIPVSRLYLPATERLSTYVISLRDISPLQERDVRSLSSSSRRKLLEKQIQARDRIRKSGKKAMAEMLLDNPQPEQVLRLKADAKKVWMSMLTVDEKKEAAIEKVMKMEYIDELVETCLENVTENIRLLESLEN